MKTPSKLTGLNKLAKSFLALPSQHTGGDPLRFEANQFLKWGFVTYAGNTFGTFNRIPARYVREAIARHLHSQGALDSQIDDVFKRVRQLATRRMPPSAMGTPY